MDDWLIYTALFQKAEEATASVLAHIEALGMSVN